MNEGSGPPSQLSDVAMWHRLSGAPDNVTDDGEIVDVDAGLRTRSDKALLRAAITSLSGPDSPSNVRGLARLAASYLLAGDVETARRYVNAARELLDGGAAGID
jgi:hypothetical protein